MKKKRKVVLISVLVLAVVLAGVLAWLFIPGVDRKIEEITRSMQTVFQPNNIGKDGTAFENGGISDGNLGGGMGGAGGGGSGASSGGTSVDESSNCAETLIPHSIKKLSETSFCSVFDDVCVSKTVYCPLEVRNLDYETSGIFRFEFVFYSDEELGRTTLSESLNPREKKILNASLEITENADEKITCSYKTLSIPAREVC